ncbi:sulfotransferase [Candidatus Pseudothioglobus singularis]|nr:sulfotransferase [Candidatus Pseudothioglobus singularis]
MSIKNDRLLSKAKKLVKKGEIKEARKIYLNILEYSSSNKEAKIGLKSIENEDEAQLSQEQLDYVIQLYSSGQMDKALLSIKELIQDFPNIPLLHNISGACNSALGEIDSAIISFNKAIELKPDYDEAYFNLGVAFHQTGKLGEALNSYEIAISIKHAYPTAHNNLGLIALSQGQLDNALKSFEWAVAYGPEYAEAHNSLGAALQELKQFEKAKASFKKAVALNPQYAQGLHNLAILCEIINLPDEASEYYEKALAVEPNYAEAYRNQSRTKKYKKNDPQIKQMQSIYSNDNLSIADKVHINFALAKVNEDLGNQKDFFKHLDEGSRLRKKQLNYNINETEEFHSSLIRLFSEDQPKIKQLSLGPLDIRPIFIVGMPRSGTSLVEQIISSHHSVHGAGELNNFKNVVTPSLKNYIGNITNTINEDDLLSIRKNYIKSLMDLNVSEKIITDKMPVNFRMIGLILTAIPEAKIIHLTRNPKATCWSNYKHYFANENGFTFDQEDLARFFILYQELMGFWHKSFPNKIHDISYERLTTHQEDETQKLLKYCELDWDNNCLNFHKNTRAVHTASASQVRQKMYQGSSDAWKKYEKFLQPLIMGLNQT